MPFPQAERNVTPGGPGAQFTVGPLGQRAAPPRPVAQLPPNQLAPGFANRALPQSTLDAFARYAAAEVANKQPPSRKQQRKQQHRKARRFLALVVVLAAVAGGAVHYREQLFGPDDPAHPAEWDPRVTPIVAFVEQARSLQFEHPIFIDFLAEPDYVALFDEPPAAAADPARLEHARQASAIYNAQGLAVGYDPLAGEQTVSSVSTLGFYSPDDDRIFVRGDVLTPAVRTTIAHELTHALQDQHFDLTLGGENDLELRSVVEADAMRIEDQYVATMTPEEQAAAISDNAIAPDEQAVLDTVPATVVESRYAPYQLGPMLLDAVATTQGNAGVDELLEHPPTEMVLLDPGLYGTTIVDEEIQVPVPDGSTTIEPSQRLSELQLLFMLDAWLPWDMARSAIDEWTGGGYVSYERADGTVCFSAIAQFARSAERLNTALTWWAGAAGSTAVPLIEGNRVSFSSCDRGPGAAAPPAQDISTLSSLGFEYAYVRQSVESATAAGSATTPAVMRAIATCEARALASDTTTVPLLLLDVIPQDQMPLVDAVRTTADAACAAPPGV